MKWLTLLFLPATSFSQSGLFPYVDNKIQYEEVVLMDSGYTRDALYDNAVLFIHDAAKKYNNQITYKETYGLNNYITTSNKESGELTGVSRIIAEQALDWTIISFDVYLYMKDSKYKYILKNFTIVGNGVSNAIAKRNVATDNPFEKSDKSKNGYTKSVQRNIDVFIQNLKDKMKAKKQNNDF